MKILKRQIDKATALDINKTLAQIGMYAWIGAGVCFCAYLYFVGAITFSVVKERGLQQETKALISSIGSHELTYLNTQKNLTEAYATSLGFIPAPTVAFATPQRAFAWNVGR